MSRCTDLIKKPIMRDLYQGFHENRGNLNIENKVVLGKTGVLTGDIQSSILTIEEGGNFDGMCNMLKPSESKVQKISSISS